MEFQEISKNFCNRDGCSALNGTPFLITEGQNTEWCQKSQHFPSTPSSKKLPVPRIPRRVVMAPRLLEFKEHLDDTLSHMV